MALMGSGGLYFLSADAYRRDRRFRHAVYRDTLFGIVGYHSAASRFGRIGGRGWVILTHYMRLPGSPRIRIHDLPKRIRQLRDVHRDPSRMVRRAAAVLHDEGGAGVLGRP
jgi:hypothetical protein